MLPVTEKFAMYNFTNKSAAERRGVRVGRKSFVGHITLTFGSLKSKWQIVR